MSGTYPWAQKDEEEPGWDGDLCQVPQVARLGEPDESRKRFVQLFQLSDQDVGSLGPLGDLLHKVLVFLLELVRAVVAAQVSVFAIVGAYKQYTRRVGSKQAPVLLIINDATFVL